MSYQKQSAILNRVLLSTSTEISYTIEEPHHLNLAVRVYNVFFVDGLEGFRYETHSTFQNAKLITYICRRISKHISVKYFDLSGYYTIVLTERVKEPYKLSRIIFADLWSAHIINVNIISFENFTSSSVFTFFPYTADHCNNARPVLWDYFIDGHFTKNKPIFASKFANFHGCPLTLATYNVPPYVMLNRFPNGTASTELDGIEGLLYRTLSKKMNFQTVIFPDNRNFTAREYFDMVRLKYGNR